MFGYNLQYWFRTNKKTTFRISYTDCLSSNGVTKGDLGDKSPPDQFFFFYSFKKNLNPNLEWMITRHK